MTRTLITPRTVRPGAPPSAGRRSAAGLGGTKAATTTAAGTVRSPPHPGGLRLVGHPSRRQLAAPHTATLAASRCMARRMASTRTGRPMTRTARPTTRSEARTASRPPHRSAPVAVSAGHQCAPSRPAARFRVVAAAMGRVGGVPADVVRVDLAVPVVPVAQADRADRAAQVVRTVPAVLGVPVGQAARGVRSVTLAGASVVATAPTTTAKRDCPRGRSWPNGEI
jgi:hypothetical protein